MSDLETLARRVHELAGAKSLSIVTAESCTAGKLAALLSEAPGAAERLHGSFVTYTKENKTRALGVEGQLLAAQGAVCPDVACAMAEGALARSPADVAVSITGVAGPNPDEDGNPVGRVCMAARTGMAPQPSEHTPSRRRAGGGSRCCICCNSARWPFPRSRPSFLRSIP